MANSLLLTKATELFCELTNLTKRQISLEERIANCKLVQGNEIKKAKIKLKVLNELLCEFNYQFINQPHFNPISEEIFDSLFVIDEEYNDNQQILLEIEGLNPEQILSQVTECEEVTDAIRIKAMVLKSIHQIEWTKTRIYLLENVLREYKENIKRIEKVIEWVKQTEIELLELDRRAVNSREMSRIMQTPSESLKKCKNVSDSQETLNSDISSESLQVKDIQSCDYESDSSVVSVDTVPVGIKEMLQPEISKMELDNQYIRIFFWFVFTISIKILS
ncbi:hypothetical protein HDV06_004765 [Boothiomyces sp. JEL0866]|nr:hypothetical protein HDV06_004765 [Boothiomyces sp. JEL0866]